MNDTLKAFLVCLFCAFIGAVVALQLGVNGWVGLIVGLISGYLTIDFKKVIQAVKNAWKTAISKERWYRIKEYFYLVVTFGATVGIGMGLLTGLTVRKFGGVSWGIFGMTTLSISLLWSCCFMLDPDYEKIRRRLLRLNPICFYFWLLPKGIVFLIKHSPRLIPQAVNTLVKFLKHVLIEIHSDLRLLCGIDSAIGAAIGWICGNAIIGGLAGGIIGALNYELISKRILHLVPAKD